MNGAVIDANIRIALREKKEKTKENVALASKWKLAPEWRWQTVITSRQNVGSSWNPISSAFNPLWRLFCFNGDAIKQESSAERVSGGAAIENLKTTCSVHEEQSAQGAGIGFAAGARRLVAPDVRQSARWNEAPPSGAPRCPGALQHLRRGAAAAGWKGRQREGSPLSLSVFAFCALSCGFGSALFGRGLKQEWTACQESFVRWGSRSTHVQLSLSRSLSRRLQVSSSLFLLIQKCVLSFQVQWSFC